MHYVRRQQTMGNQHRSVWEILQRMDANAAKRPVKPIAEVDNVICDPPRQFVLLVREPLLQTPEYSPDSLLCADQVSLHFLPQVFAECWRVENRLMCSKDIRSITWSTPKIFRSSIQVTMNLLDGAIDSGVLPSRL
jgi:hypothetical protein